MLPRPARRCNAEATFSPEKLAERTLHRRAIEAVSWGMPVVNFDRMYQAFVAINGGPNQIVYWSRPFGWKNQTLTPNPDTLYFMPFYDVTNGPVVLEIPPAGEGVIVGSIDDAWQTAIEDVGPAGADKGRGGKYLILPPGHKDPVPGGYIALRSETYSGFALLRSNPKSRDDAGVAAAVLMRRRSGCIRCRRPPIHPRLCSSTPSTLNTTRPFRTTCASSSRWIAWCRTSPG